MSILIALDSFKGSVSAMEASLAVKEAINESLPSMEVVIKPISDGGEGLLCVLDFAKESLVEIKVNNPKLREVNASYLVLKDGTCVIEVAQAAGLYLLEKKEQNPLHTTSYGVGELIKDALDKGFTNFIIGLGGSATNDGGMGMLRALGYRFFDKDQNELLGFGKDLLKLAFISDSLKHKGLLNAKFSVAADVINPLFGKNGAAFIYAGQKGANDEEIALLDYGLKNYAFICKDFLKHEKDFHVNPGCGAAGGLGYAFEVFLNAKVKSGIDMIMEQNELLKDIQKASLVITGEGEINSQSLQGKAPLGVAKLALQCKVPCIGLAGSLDEKLDFKLLEDEGLCACFCIHSKLLSKKEAMSKAQSLKGLKNTTKNIISLLKHSKALAW